MKNFFIFIFSAGLVLLQLSAEGVFFSPRRIPDLAMAFTITLILTLGFNNSIKWILLMGILLNIGSSTVFGTEALVYFLIGWAISGLADIADIRSKKTFFLVSLAVFVVVSEVLKDLLILAGSKLEVKYFQASFGAPLHILSSDYLLKIFYTILAAYIIYYIFRRISRTLFLEPVRLIKN